ncbi:YpdA family putative bacillithiol disulfide reductase [Fulvivirga sediminis]|uniref:YpdA family putative bacillithiol disulfide reductase n=1 Tax=Fulvivirga sediminis TaxID=2803949 RepID=A0A937F1P4_9BACT|nr:YpdA family putative bacillithiol disulfide reductase [Fulvivirga sediminis]MBL3654651.1 YpdA family putative bacillithiol disulfide reductase [Fulvivirga sediminis]
MHDVLIIGAGPIGLACGIEAEKAGLEYVIIDKGCLVNSIYNYPLGMTFFSSSEKLEIGGVPFISHLNKPNRFEALEYYRRVAMTWSLKVRLYEEVKTAVKEEDGIFTITTSKGVYKTKAVIIATGFYDIPYLMNVPGEDLPKVAHYYKEPHPYFGQKIIVVGAANSAVDVALETYRKGAEVTMVVRESGILDTVKYWVKPDIENRIEEGSIKSYFNSEITEIRPHEVDIMTPDGPKTVENDYVMAMTGYKPNFSLMEAMGVEFQKDELHTPIFNDKTQESNVENIYLAGVVCGGLKTNKWFIENSRVHAEVIIEDLAIKKK